MNLPEFFKFSTEQEFFYYTAPHFIPIILMCIVIYLLYRFQDQIRNWKHEENLRFGLAIFVILMHFTFFWHFILIDEATAARNLPITVCGWAIIFSSFMLFTKKQVFFDIVYFFVLAGSINALITPGVLFYAGPLRYRYYQFWLDHTFIFINVFYMIFVLNYRVSLKSLRNSFIALLVLAGVAVLANSTIEGANYLYLAGSVSGGSILDYLPADLLPRILTMGSIITVLYFIVYSPWYFIHKKQQAHS